MCGRYGIDDSISAEEWQELIESLNRRGDAARVKTSGEIRPADTVPILASSRTMAPAAFAMAWGFTAPDGKRIINARSESAPQRPLFRDALERHRCAVPASRYYEWERAGKQRTKYAIRPAGGGLMYMAGIYRLENGRPVFAILTREAAGSIAFIHDRMPVLLPAGRVADWIDPRPGAGELLREAILEVRFEKAEGEAPEQLAMEI